MTGGQSLQNDYAMKLHRRIRYFYCAILWMLPIAAYTIDPFAASQQLEQLGTQLSALDQLLQQLNSDRSEAQQRLQILESTIGELNNRIAGIEQVLQSEQQTLLNCRQQRQTLLQHKQQQQQAITQQMRVMHLLGRQNKLKLLLNQENPAAVGRALAYYDYIHRAHARQLAAYQATLAQIDQLEMQIIANTQSLADGKQQLQQQHDKLADKHNSRRQQLAAIHDTIKNHHQQRQQLAKEYAELEAVLAAIEQTAREQAAVYQQAFATHKGRLLWPVDTQIWSGKLSHRFGERRHNSGLRWQGLLLPVPAGSTVYSIHPGRVVFADWLQGFGLLIIIDHDDDYLSLYAHNQSLLRSVGDWVDRAAPIATVGNSGGQAQASLYFEIRHQGKPVNPEHWCTPL